MERLVLFFDEGPAALGPIGQRLLDKLGGLDMDKPEKWGRYGMGICEDYIGYPVRAPRDIQPEELLTWVSAEARNLGILPCEPRTPDIGEVLLAINKTTRAISAANGHPLDDRTMTNMDFNVDSFEGCAADMFLAVLDNLADGTRVQNILIRA